MGDMFSVKISETSFPRCRRTTIAIHYDCGIVSVEAGLMRASLPLSLVGGPVALRQIMQSLLGELQHNLSPYLMGVPSGKSFYITPLWSFQSWVGIIPEYPYGLVWVSILTHESFWHPHV